MLANPFGHFDASGRAFVITDAGTPMPWVNVVSNGRYGFVVSQNGGGFSWLDSSQFGVITRWEMDLVRDASGRFVYLRDLESDALWSLAPAPCRPAYDRYECAHTLGSTTFRTECQGIGAEWTLAVAPEDPVEVWRVRLTNRTDRARRLRIASYFEWCCGVAPDAKREFHRLFFTVRHDPVRSAILAGKNMWDVPARDETEHWNRPWPHVAAHAVGGIEFESPLAIGDKAMFLGRYGDPAAPAAVRTDSPTVGGFGRFGDASAALGGDFRIGPGETVQLHYLMVVADDDAGAGALLDRYNRADAVGAAISGAGRAWEERLSPTRIATEQPDVDLLSNHWLPYQAISGRLWARTGYYQQSGAYGFRDQLQDSQVWLPLEPARCREQILLHAAHQFADGSVYHWWHPQTETGLRTLCSDDYLWLSYVVLSYLRETGDFSLLEATAPYVDERAGGTILDHCLQAFARASERMSGRGLPLIGSCDWNDGLSALGVGGKGESVWLGFFLAGLLRDFAEVLDRTGRASLGEEFRSRRQCLLDAVNEHAWDGAWFRRATGDDGRWIGSSENTEGRIFLNPQTWAILTDGTTEERAGAAWRAMQEHLLAEMGPRLLTPAYSEPDPGIGYITRYAPGARENGGVYMHAATWVLAAACKRRDVRTAERIWRAISPPLRGMDATAYQAEPYVTPGSVDGPASVTPGRAGWTWYTGSAAWLHRVCMEGLLGVRPTLDGLVIDPCPLPGMGRVEVTRAWRGGTVRVRFDAREFSAAMPAKLVVDGREASGNLVPAAGWSPGRSADVEVRWGITARPSRVPGAAAGRTTP